VEDGSFLKGVCVGVVCVMEEGETEGVYCVLSNPYYLQGEGLPYVYGCTGTRHLLLLMRDA
jgi:hypothetical protein